ARQPLAAPLSGAPHELARDVPMLVLLEPDEDDRQVARDAVRPERADAPFASLEDLARRAEGRIGVDAAVGEALEEERLIRCDPEMVELDLRLRPGERHDPVEGPGVAVLV